MFPISDSIKSGKFPFVTLLIIAVTVYVFYLQITTPGEQVIREFALTPNKIDFSNFYSLVPFISAIFLHGGFLHIISNMWFLWVFGDDVEANLGRFKFLALYLTAGLAGNISQFVLMQTSQIPMLGASGAVAGILGAYYVMFPHSTIKTLLFIFIFITIVNIPAPFMLGYWFILQVLSGVYSLPFSGGGGIAFFAHIGGFLFGMVMAVIAHIKK